MKWRRDKHPVAIAMKILTIYFLLSVLPIVEKLREIIQEIGAEGWGALVVAGMCVRLASKVVDLLHRK